MSTTAQPQPALLSARDLDDPAQFTRVGPIPLLDVHTDPNRGDVDERLLNLLARNTNRHVRLGNFPELTLGHTKRKHTVMVVGPDGKKVVAPGADEPTQPDIAGYGVDYHVAPFRGQPTLHCYYHIHNHLLNESRRYPHRSVERMFPNEQAGNDSLSDHFIDKVALLKSPPERDLGVTHYARQNGTGTGTDTASPNDDERLLCACYARDLGPGTWDAEDAASPAEPESAAPPIPDDTVFDPSTASAPSTSTSPDPASAPAASAAQQEPPMALTPEDFGQIAEIVRTILHEHIEMAPPDAGGGEAPPEDEYDDVPPEGDVNDEPEPDAPPPARGKANYAAGELGGNSGYVPGDGGIGPAKKPAAPCNKPVMAEHYARDHDEQHEINLQILNELLDLKHDKRVANYERTLRTVQDEGVILDMATELAELTKETPAGFEDRAVAKMRANYHRTSAGKPRVPTIEPEAPKGRISALDMKKAGLLARKKGISFSDACAELKLV